MDDNNFSGIGRLAEAAMYFPEDKERNLSARATARLIINRMPTPAGQRGYDVIPLVAWGSHAETLRNYGASGKEVFVRGAIRTTSKKNDDGSYDNRWECKVERISLGRDSTVAKMAKASVATGLPVETMTDLEQLMNSPEVQKVLNELAHAQPKLAAAASKPSQKVAPSQEAENPFSE